MNDDIEKIVSKFANTTLGKALIGFGNAQITGDSGIGNIPTVIVGKTGIKIKKSHQGLFTEYCNGKVTQKCIDKAKRSGNKKLVKRAVFAQNSRKWAKKHDGGGTIKEWYNQKLYNYVDPTGNYPSNMAKAIGLGLFTLFNGENQTYQVTDSVADAAWRKRLGLEYDSKFLPENEDGSVRLPKNVEKEIPVDTTFIKNRIQKNKKIRDYYVNKLGRSESNDLIQIIDIASEIDKETLDSLRHTYKTGDWVVINEHGNNSRQLIEAGDYKLSNSPLNVLHNYGIRYNKDNNTIEYKDTYDFNQYEWGVPGKPFEIRGRIKLKNKRRVR